MSITWKLKEGLKWSDGSDMTAEDVVFTWLYCVDEDTGCTTESSFDGIASVLALDNLTVRIAFDAPTPYPYRAFVGAGTPIISRAQHCSGYGDSQSEANRGVPSNPLVVGLAACGETENQPVSRSTAPAPTATPLLHQLRRPR